MALEHILVDMTTDNIFTFLKGMKCRESQRGIKNFKNHFMVNQMKMPRSEGVVLDWTFLS